MLNTVGNDIQRCQLHRIISKYKKASQLRNEKKKLSPFLLAIQFTALFSIVTYSFLLDDEIFWTKKDKSNSHVIDSSLHRSSQQNIVIFLQIQNSGGDWFTELVSNLRDQVLPSADGVLVCPKSMNEDIKMLCGSDDDRLLQFWTWPVDVQILFLLKLNVTFIVNKRCLGREYIYNLNGRALAKESAQRSTSKYLIIIRNPLDRIASYFHHANRHPAGALYGRNLSFSAFVRAGPCRELDSGSRCWDANHYVQVDLDSARVGRSHASTFRSIIVSTSRLISGLSPLSQVLIGGCSRSTPGSSPCGWSEVPGSCHYIRPCPYPSLPFLFCPCLYLSLSPRDR